MWQESYSTYVQGLEPKQIWKIWSDISTRAKWDDDIEWAKADGPFQNGTTITMKPKDWPKAVSMKLMDCVPYQQFTDRTEFFLATLYGTHHMEVTTQGLKLTTTIKVTGLLSWFWRRVVAQDIVKTLPHQTQMLIELAKK